MTHHEHDQVDLLDLDAACESFAAEVAEYRRARRAALSALDRCLGEEDDKR